ncbi:MAG: RNA 2',3'-cyclic phosphodiesterase [Bacteroidales bacterium]|jgi:2'-5' RNA ligase|nr:RNA 2',3'-cyclic phosphodiesterase [Bacteroidales bacterium]
MKRVFIAIKVVPDGNLQRIYSDVKYLLNSEKISWVDPSNIHLTLSFLGDIQDAMIKTAGIVLKEKCSGFGEFTFNLKGTGVFKNFRDPRVIWTGIDHAEKLMKLNEHIINGLRGAGFIIEDRPFKPHITLGRIKLLKDFEALKSAVLRHQDTFIQEVHVTEVILYESILKFTGPVYKPIGIYKLS